MATAIGHRYKSMGSEWILAHPRSLFFSDGANSQKTLTTAFNQVVSLGCDMLLHNHKADLAYLLGYYYQTKMFLDESRMFQIKQIPFVRYSNA
jgi:hypothetical protein